MAATRRTRVLLWVGGGVLLAIVLFFASIGLLIYRTIETRPATAAEADAAMASIRQRYAGRRPLLEIVDLRTRQTRLHRTAGRERRKVDVLHFMVWDPRKQTLLQGEAPAWTLRLKLSLFGSGGWSFEDLGITIEDVERYAPGILIDHRLPEGDHALIWAD